MVLEGGGGGRGLPAPARGPPRGSPGAAAAAASRIAASRTLASPSRTATDRYAGALSAVLQVLHLLLLQPK